MRTIRVVTAAGVNASEVGGVYATTYNGSWRNSVDRCDADGCGRVFLDFPSRDAAGAACDAMDDDDRVVSYSLVP